jgi:hypothetical protein
MIPSERDKEALPQKRIPLSRRQAQGNGVDADAKFPLAGVFQQSAQLRREM